LASAKTHTSSPACIEARQLPVYGFVVNGERFCFLAFKACKGMYSALGKDAWNCTLTRSSILLEGLQSDLKITRETLHTRQALVVCSDCSCLISSYAAHDREGK
jgi:hypothetical protein